MQRYRILIVVAVVFFYWSIGFYPFQWEMPFRIVDNAISATEPLGLKLDMPGIAYTNNAPEWLDTAIATSSIRITLEIRVLDPLQYGPARILTISQDPYLRNLTIGQEGADLIVRIRHPNTDQNGLPPYKIREVFSMPGWHEIDISIARQALVIRIDETEVLSAPLPVDPLSQWSPDYRLALGNELTFNRPWLGDIRHATVAVGKWNIDYSNPGRLYYPRHFTIINAHYDLIPFIKKPININTLLDSAINLFGFIPFGIMIVVVTKRRLSILTAMTSCAALSLSIEIGQLFLVGRVTETGDLVLNVLGGTFGAWIGKHSSLKP